MTTQKNQAKNNVKRRVKWLGLSLVFIVVSAMVLPLTAYLITGTDSAVQAQVVGDENLRSNFWRVVRDGGTGYSSVVGNDVNTETNTLYNPQGLNWQQLRNGIIANYGGWALFFTILAILAFFVIRGRIELDEPESGETVPRWTLAERTLHWYTASLFIVLAITGLSMLFGRALLIPIFGLEGFNLWASFSISVHNTIGPFFTIGPLLMLVFWIRHNIPNAVDVKWFLVGGGIIGKAHPSAGKANGGEKAWYWIVMIVGLGFVCYTGFVLIGWIEAYFGVPLTRESAQTMHVWHAVAALIWIAVFFGHVYIGTVGSAGSLDAMTKGRVSVEWAKQHHDLWYETVKDQATSGSGESSPARESAATT